MMKTLGSGRIALIAASCLAVGCDRSDKEFVDSNALGIAYLEVDRSFEDDDPVLAIRGFDDDGIEIASLRLRSGLVSYTPDPGGIEDEATDGSELSIEIGNNDIAYVNPAREPMVLPEPSGDDFAAFVGLSQVAAAIENEAGIVFVSAPDRGDDEIAYSPAACAASSFSVDHSQCCQDGTTGWLKIGFSGGVNAHKLAERQIGTPCTNTSGLTGCALGGTPCAYGPCGSRNIWIAGDVHAQVFHLNPNPDTSCGRDPDGSGPGPGTPNYVNQTGWSSIVGTCPYTACRSDGTRGIRLTLTAICASGVTGSVTWAGNTTSCNGNTVSRTFWYPYNTVGTVTKSNPSATWGGPCSGTGTCSKTFTSDSTVSANFATADVSWTSQTIKGGTEYTGQPATCAFDNAFVCWLSLYSSPGTYIGQDFGSTPRNIRVIKVAKTASFSFNSTLQYSDNGTTWFNTNVTIVYPPMTSAEQTYNVNDYGAHRYWRFLDAQDDAMLQIMEIGMFP